VSNGIDAWSYSRYADYKSCPLKFKLKYIDKLPTAGSPAMDRGNAIHKMAEDYVKAHGKKKPKLPIELTSVKDEIEHCRSNNAIAELPWGFRKDWAWTGKPNWFGSEVWFRMKADVVVEYDDNTGLVGDWKTGRKYFENEEQIELFGAAALMRFPDWSEVDVRLWYTDQPKDDNEIDRQYTRKEGALILKTWEKKVVPMFVDKRFAPTPNDKCKWCDFSKAKGGPCKF
jgi:RecB family exonuclease